MNSDRVAKVGDRVLYRSPSGEDVTAGIVAIWGDGSADLELEGGARIVGVERSAAGDDSAFLNSWRPVERFLPPAVEHDSAYTEALAAGLVVMLLDAAAGAFPLTMAGLPAALESFRNGVGLVLELQE